MSRPPAVEVLGLVKRYGTHEVVRGLDLEAPHGAVTAVLGPNGAGKTTTVECCEGLRIPDAGRVRVLGADPARHDPGLRARVGVMLQDGGLPTGVRALEMLRHVSAMYAAPRDVGELAERLGLHSFGSTTVRRLSGGQRQRLALAAALLGRPEVVFLDEPSAGLDPQSRRAVWDLVTELRDEGVAVVLTTHLMDEAEALADQVVVIDAGRVIARGTVPELLAGRHGGPSDGGGREDGAGADVEGHRGGTGTLRLTTPDALDLAALLDVLGREGRSWTGQATGAGDYLLNGPVDPGSIALLTRWCAEHDVLATSLSAGRRTLEDVFLDLTGRSLR